jgi:hypothetical protein
MPRLIKRPNGPKQNMCKEKRKSKIHVYLAARSNPFQLIGISPGSRKSSHLCAQPYTQWPNISLNATPKRLGKHHVFPNSCTYSSSLTPCCRYLRVDSLSQILNFANVHAEARYLVVDDTQGLVLSAVAERMGGYGQILGIYDGLNQNYDVLRYHNFSKRVLDTISALPWNMIDNNEPISGRFSPQGLKYQFRDCRSIS